MRLPVALLIAFTAGCSATVEDGAAFEGSDEGSVQGAVIVDQVVTNGTPKTRVSARFVRVSGGIDQATAEQVIGTPRFDAASGLGCTVLSRPGLATGVSSRGLASEGLEGEVGASASTGSIELLDVGDLVLHVFEATMADEPESSPPQSNPLAFPQSFPLAARAFPDVGELISGVVYTSRDGDEVVPSGGSFLIETSGSSQVEAFSLRVDAPLAPTQVTFGELDEVALAGEPLAISWDAGQPALGDRIYVDITPVDGDDLRTLRCVLDDDGHDQIPAAVMAFRPETLLDIELHRHRRTGARLDAVDEAVVDFDFAVAARVLVAEYTVP